MSGRKYTLPSFNALAAFEAVARLQGFARAAEELNTSQPAISRHIRNLEIRFGTLLFDRNSSPVRLTGKGQQFYAGMVQGLDVLQDTVRDLARSGNLVTLVCSHSVSHLLLMPRHGQLRKALGPEADLRLLTAEYNLTRSAIDTGADIVFEYAQVPPSEAHVVVCEEEIKPVGTPEVIDQAKGALNGACAPPPLLELSNDNYGWMNWRDWQRAHPGFGGWQVGEQFDSYVYLLEAAAAGAGLGLGWRSFADPYLSRGSLVEMPVSWHSRNTRLYAKLTRFGRSNPAAQRCLGLLEAAFPAGRD
ncbi:LysR family transcriptional regulator [Leisingera daeponensis]|uniref:LysR family transcriptional regulator n=1 Tax=Leisingera daeponensis TaxID=405746 RepID=UPI001C950F41|nr:LysR family transcriptional regulator [Leisingera daeponensis]MBY6058934.1 LysR family transcriptional regulator [Leisingera daeponensis]